MSPARAADLAARRGATRVTVVLPARNEAATVGGIVAALLADLVEPGAIDEVVVMDSDSTDATAALARDAGARVCATRDVRPDLGAHPGKGEAIWKAQFACDTDIFVFLDADLRTWGTHFVADLLDPLLRRPEVGLVKGRYARPTETGGGGRVTELVARPLIALHAPGLAHVAQPLGGEWAVRADLLAALPLPTGYAVDLAVLLGAAERGGAGAVAQADLGVRDHAHQDLAALGAMSAQLMAYAAGRTAALDLRTFPPGAPDGVLTRVPLDLRPPAASVPPPPPAPHVPPAPGPAPRPRGARGGRRRS